MKRSLLILSLSLTVGATPLSAALRFGLGSAVAKRSADLMNQAYQETGNNGFPFLPSCGSKMALFTAPPVTDPTFVAINPIGHVFPPGHTFPADHGYFAFSGTSANVNLYAPGDGWVTQVITLSGSGNTSDGYVIQFSPCAEVKLGNLSLNTLAPVLATPSGLTKTTCSSDGQNFPGAVASCVTNMQVPVKAGQFLGTGGLVDFGPIEDSRYQIAGFVNPARHDLNRGFCPLNYFAPSLQATYTAMLGAWNGTAFVPRTIPPLCGTIMQDLAGSAQGYWYYPGAPNIPENPHLALIHFNIDPATATFSVGTSIPNFAGGHDFIPKTVADGTRINYDFKIVHDTQLYCYDSLLIEFVAGVGSPDPQLAGHLVLIQLSPSLDTLTIELQNPTTSCTATAGNWAFTGNAVQFQR